MQIFFLLQYYIVHVGCEPHLSHPMIPIIYNSQYPLARRLWANRIIFSLFHPCIRIQNYGAPIVPPRGQASLGRTTRTTTHKFAHFIWTQGKVSRQLYDAYETYSSNQTLSLVNDNALCEGLITFPSLKLMPQSNQNLNTFKNCLVKHGLKLFPLQNLLAYLN